MVHQWPEHDAYLDWLQKIAATEGPILELAVGPGDGASMIVLDLNPNAHYIMNELGLWLLRQWQAFARKMSVGSGDDRPHHKEAVSKPGKGAHESRFYSQFTS